MDSLFIAAGLLAGTVVSPVEGAEWPTLPAGKVIQTPDWSDYRIYPEAARKREQEGIVTAQVAVGTDGRPQRCRIIHSSGFAELDEGTCRLMMTMRFASPAIPGGAAVSTQFTRRIGWVLAEQRALAASSIRVVVDVAAGQLLGCNIAGGEGAYHRFWSVVACSFFSDLPFYLNERAQESGTMTVEARLRPEGSLAFSETEWPRGSPVAIDRVTFSINSDGDASGCTSTVFEGFGPRGLNNLSPCGRLLSGLWFKRPKRGAPRGGAMETRVYWTKAD